MSSYDEIYKEMCLDIYNNGVWDKDQNVRTKWEDGTPAYTKTILNKQLKIDNKEVPILTQKKVAWKSAIAEMLWIWQMKSNKVQDLRDLNMTFNGGKNESIWDNWMLTDGTIGKAYGYQLSQLCRKGVSIDGEHGLTHTDMDQVDYLIHSLKNNPASRRHIITLWDKDDLDEMSLTPCVWSTHWQVVDGELHVTVNIRSNDIALGNPFNIFQYHVLQRMLCQVVGLKLGTLTANIDNAHLYERHIYPVIQEQLIRETLEAPTLWINPDVKNFYDFTMDDFNLIGYNHGEAIPMEIAI